MCVRMYIYMYIDKHIHIYILYIYMRLILPSEIFLRVTYLRTQNRALHPLCILCVLSMLVAVSHQFCYLKDEMTSNHTTLTLGNTECITVNLDLSLKARALAWRMHTSSAVQHRERGKG